jgi:hypothetical protein
MGVKLCSETLALLSILLCVEVSLCKANCAPPALEQPIEGAFKVQRG